MPFTVVDVADEVVVNAAWLAQDEPHVTALGDGGWLVVQQADDSSGSGITIARYDVNGVPLQLDFVNDLTLDDQVYPSASALYDNGVYTGFVVTWASAVGAGTGTYDIYQRQFDTNGSPIGSEVKVSTVAAPAQLAPQVTGLANGGWVVTWQAGGDLDGDGYGVFQRLYDNLGQPVDIDLGKPGETLVSTVTANWQDTVPIRPRVTST